MTRRENVGRASHFLPAAPEPAGLPALSAAVPVSRLLSAFLGGKSPETVRAYERDLRAYAAWRGAPSVEAAAAELLGAGAGPANALAVEYRNALEARLAPATVARRLSALRALVDLARLFGVVPWQLQIRDPERQPYRDVRGPGRDGFVALLAAAQAQRSPRLERDVAILRLLYDLALRRGEVVGIDVGDVEDDGVWVRRKRKREKVRLTLPPPTAAAVRVWLAVRGELAEPAVFLNFHHNPAIGGRRLTGRGVARIVAELGQKAGLGHVRPHGLRHAAITEALDRTGGDLRQVQKFSGHANVQTLLIYDDARRDMQGHVAALVAEAASEAAATSGDQRGEAHGPPESGEDPAEARGHGAA